MDDDNKNEKGYSRPKFNESEISELMRRYKKNHQEEFPNLRKPPRKGYPANPPANLPLS